MKKDESLIKVGDVLMSAIAKLDERGTDETVSKAMSIVYSVINEKINGKELTADEAYKICNQEKLLNEQ
ncbi:MAG: hypothetical protein ACUZ8E_00425 [Candidatus Anammoxibacter sp.]